MAVTLLAFGNHAFSSLVDGYEVGFAPGPVVQVEASVTTRPWVPPRLDAVTPGARTIELVAWITDPALSVEEFRRRLSQVFNPLAGEALLVAERPDGTIVELPARCSRITYRGESEIDAKITLETRETAWRTVTEQSSSGSTLTVGGNVAARPRIVLATPVMVCTRQRYVVRDQTRRGVGGYPLLLASAWPATAYNTVVFQNGLAVPFTIVNRNLWVRVDIPPDGSTILDCYYGPGVQNAVTADALHPGGLDLAASDNTTWVIAPVPDAPLSASGTLRQGRTYPHADQRDYLFGTHLITTGDGHVLAGMLLADRDMPEATQGLYNDTDSYVCIAGTSIVRAQIRLSGQMLSWAFDSASGETLSRTEIVGGGWLEVVVRYPGRPDWDAVARQPVPKEPGDQRGFSYDVDLTFHDLLPVALALRAAPAFVRRSAPINSSHDFDDGRRLEVTRYLSTGVRAAIASALTLELENIPTVILVETVSAGVWSGTIVNQTTGDWIELDQVYADGQLILDGEARSVVVPSGPFYARGVRFRDGIRWIQLVPGQNQVTAPWPVTIYWRNRWLV